MNRHSKNAALASLRAYANESEMLTEAELAELALEVGAVELKGLKASLKSQQRLLEIVEGRPE